MPSSEEESELLLANLAKVKLQKPPQLVEYSVI